MSYVILFTHDVIVQLPADFYFSKTMIIDSVSHCLSYGKCEKNHTPTFKPLSYPIWSC